MHVYSCSLAYHVAGFLRESPKSETSRKQDSTRPRLHSDCTLHYQAVKVKFQHMAALATVVAYSAAISATHQLRI
jgi:hypothetical protein